MRITDGRQVAVFLAGVLVLCGALLTGCVSTTETVFTDEASPEKALQTRVALARQYIAEGNWDYAKRNLELASEIDPNSAAVSEAFGLMYQRTGELELAEEHFERAIKLDRDCSRCRNNYAVFLYSQERYREAESQLERVVKDSLYSGRPRAFVNLGLCRQKLFDAQGAEEAFVRALSMDKTNRIALLEVAQLRYDAGDYQAAGEYYDRYRSLVRKQSPRGLWLGIRLAQIRGDQDAEASYVLVLSNLYPESAEYAAYQRTLRGD